MASVSLRHIYKIYDGKVKAVQDFCLDIEDKEFVVFVGPSGCGKSTTLRMVAGLEDISSGELYIDGRLVNEVEPKDRDIAMVFQNYALYPHMTVYENMAFGLKIRKIKPSEIDERVKEAAKMLQIEKYLTRKPKALSGGQRQRVALGRALVRYPKVFLLDEPLSNLDAKLRVGMRTEITKLHKKLQTTFIYVTHDQVEAMTMGTRIVVMKDGVVQQVDTPQNLYDDPTNLFVASFIGTPQMNMIAATLGVDESGQVYCQFGQNKIVVPQCRTKKLVSKEYLGKEVWLGVRPEDIHDEQVFVESNQDCVMNAKVEVTEKLGNETILYLKVDGKEDYAVARVNARSNLQVGDEVQLGIDTKHIHFFDKDTELSILSVPKINLIEDAQVSRDGDAWSVSFLDKACVLPPIVVDRIVDKERIGLQKVTLGLRPEHLKVEKEWGDADKEHCCKLAVTVDFVERHSGYSAVYCKLPGKEGVFVAFVKTVVPENGQKLDLFFDPKDLCLYGSVESTQGEGASNKLLASKPLGKNEVVCQTTPKGTGTQVVLGDNQKVSVVIDKSLQADKIAIDKAGIYVDKDKLKEFANTKMNAKVKEIDVLGDRSVLYLQLEGVLCSGRPAEVVAVVDGVMTYGKDERIKIAINPASIG